MILSECDVCRRKYRFEDDFEGEIVRCKSCTADFPVPVRTLYEKVFGQKEIRERQRGERKKRREDEEPSLLITAGVPVISLAVCLLLVIGGIEVFSAGPEDNAPSPTGETSSSAADRRLAQPTPQTPAVSSPVSPRVEPRPEIPPRQPNPISRAMQGGPVTRPVQNFPTNPETVAGGAVSDGSDPSEFTIRSARVTSATKGSCRVVLVGRNLNRLVSASGGSAPEAAASFRTPVRANNQLHFTMPPPDLPIFRIDIPGQSVFLVSNTSPASYGRSGQIEFRRVPRGQFTKAGSRVRVIVVDEGGSLDLSGTPGHRVVVLTKGARLLPLSNNRDPLTIFCTRETQLPPHSGPVRIVVLPDIRVLGLGDLHRLPFAWE